MTTSSSDRALFELDLYHLLDPSRTLTSSSPPTDISRHYRKQARLLHPDKNPDNPKAAEQFDTLQRAYELLSDESKRAEYDEKRRRREEKKRKADEEDVRVRVMRERLEEREKAGKAGWESNKRQIQAARIQRENELVIQQLRQQTQPPQPSAQKRTEERREERKLADVDEGRHDDRGYKGANVEGKGASAGLDMKAYEASTLERMRAMARRKKEEREKLQQQPANGASAHNTDSSSAKTSFSSAKRESEVIVLDDASGAIT